MSRRKKHTKRLPFDKGRSPPLAHVCWPKCNGRRESTSVSSRRSVAKHFSISPNIALPAPITRREGQYFASFTTCLKCSGTTLRKFRFFATFFRSLVNFARIKNPVFSNYDFLIKILRICDQSLVTQLQC